MKTNKFYNSGQIILVLTAIFVFTPNFSNASCGEIIQPDNDCDSNTSNYMSACCPVGYFAVGLSYTDNEDTDLAKNISPICHKISDNLITGYSDPNEGGINLPCDYTSSRHQGEVLVGIACKQLQKKSRKLVTRPGDLLDGCTAVCRDQETLKTRVIYLADLESNPSGFITHKVGDNRELRGIEWKNKVNTRSLDCATISSDEKIETIRK